MSRFGVESEADLQRMLARGGSRVAGETARERPQASAETSAGPDPAPEDGRGGAGGETGMLRPSVQVLIVEGLGPSQNDANSGKLRDRIDAKKQWKNEVRRAIAESDLRPVQRYPVRIQYRTYITGRPPRDYSGSTASEKIAVDMLVEAGILIDDDREHVRGGTFDAPRDADATYTEIIITEDA